jgi:hypothetical protein
MIAFGVASVPDVKMSSDTADASRSGAGAPRSRPSTSDSGIPARGDGSHTKWTGDTPVTVAVLATSSSWSKSR